MPAVVCGMSECPDHIHLEDPPDQLVGHSIEVMVGDHLRHPGVVHKHIDPPVGLEGRVDRARASRRITDVGLHVSPTDKRFSDCRTRHGRR